MIAQIVYTIVHAYSFVILLYCIFSWFPGSRNSGIIGDIYKVLAIVVDPYLNLFRKIIPPIGGAVDISPIIAIIVLEAIVRLIFTFLF